MTRKMSRVDMRTIKLRLFSVPEIVDLSPSLRSVYSWGSFWVFIYQDVREIGEGIVDVIGDFVVGIYLGVSATLICL